ncbi:MAG: GxxExxY protein [Bacteroidetes bacterium CG_4_10_14_3_um_filter_31_20]|nr:GxxExxY protein [Bacteroidota bacterium]PIY02392.1 MAG: GxxExxY protein [Bacteroidetes bacterium CG_4_10_14_3_um_filter_31_20]
MSELLHKVETHKIIGVCMEVHRRLGKGFLEIVYKDAIEYECNSRKYEYEREKEFAIQYKDIILSHKFYADFTVFNKIILEVKSCNGIVDEFVARTINYLAASKLKVGLIVNFGKNSLEWKRLVL